MLKYTLEKHQINVGFAAILPKMKINLDINIGLHTVESSNLNVLSVVIIFNLKGFLKDTKKT